MKVISFFGSLLFCSISAFAQNNIVQITGGNFSVFSGEISQIVSSSFNATGRFDENFESVWYQVCGAFGQTCDGGTTFKLPYSTRIGENIGTALPFVTGNVSINGEYYENVYYGGNLFFAKSFLSENLFVNIPKYFDLRRKGTYRIQHSFALYPSTFRICKVSMLNAPCPFDQTLFDGQIEGHGMVLITLRYNNQVPEPTPGYPRLIRKSFEYQFEL